MNELVEKVRRLAPQETSAQAYGAQILREGCPRHGRDLSDLTCFECRAARFTLREQERA